MRSGYLIVLTGIDGSGKTTQANLLVKDLKKDGIDVSYVWSRWEPFLLRFLIKKWKNKGAKKRDNLNQEFDELKDNKNKLLNNTLIFTLSTIFNKGINFFILPILTYYLTKEDYGSLGLIVSIVTI